MKKIMIIILMLTVSISAYSQNYALIDSLEHKINCRDSLIQGDNKKYLKVDTLLQHIFDYRDLLDLIEQRDEQMKIEADSVSTDYNFLLRLTSEDLDIFETNDPYDLSMVPYCLQKHTNVINQIILINSEISGVEKQINDIVNNPAMEGIQFDIKSLVRDNFEDDLIRIDSYMIELENMDISSLSPMQTEFYKTNLVPRYNSLIKYFD